MKATQKNEILVTNRASVVRGFFILVIFCLTLPGASPVQAQDADLEMAAAEKAYAEQTLRVGVWLDRSEDEVYRKGDSQSVSFQTNEDAFAVVYRIDTEGLVTILWPRSRLDDGFIFGGHEYILPVSGAPRLRVSSLSGEGFVEAIVSRYPFDLRDLEVDFHHEDSGRRLDFLVVGDPFLAMNEVNFAITGLEDSAEFVVTNYASYYVHQKVDHPRYLCGQCHFDDVTYYDPYQTHCSLNISYDYGWYNRWYFRFGYYPVYYYPAYTYYDPWCWRPWVNFWYDPWYVFPRVAIYTWPSTVYVWQDSPYYVGNSTIRYKEGDRSYRPLNVADRRTKPSRTPRDFIRSSTMVNRDGPGERDLEAMRSRRPLADRSTGLAERGGQTIARGKDPSLQGEVRQPWPRMDLTSRSSGTRRGGLQIQDDRNPTRADKPALRHSSAGNGRDSALKPMDPRPDNRDRSSGRSTVRGQEPRSRPDEGAVGDRSDRSSRSDGSRTIKPVEPRKKGTRIWNSSRSSQSQPEGKDRSPQVKPRDGGDRSGSSRSQSHQASPQRNSKPTPTRQPKGARVKEQPRSSSSGGGGVRQSKPPQGGGGSQPSVRPRSTQPAMSSSSARSSRGSSGNTSSNTGSRNSGGRTRGGGTPRR